MRKRASFRVIIRKKTHSVRVAEGEALAGFASMEESPKCQKPRPGRDDFSVIDQKKKRALIVKERPFGVVRTARSFK